MDQKTQHELFIESMSDALSEIVYQLGGAKKVGSMLWPEKTMKASSNLLNDCLNNDNPNKLSLEQIDLLLKEARRLNIHIFAKYIGDTYGYQFTPISPEDEKAELQKQVVKAVNDLKPMITRLEKLG